MAFYMKYGGQGPLAKKSNGALRNKSGLLMSPFAAVDCGDPTPPTRPPTIPTRPWHTKRSIRYDCK